MTYRECDNCGASLDPGEICDCQKEQAVFFPVIRCDQPPVIFENLEDVQRNLDAIMESVKLLPKNDESLAAVKKLRAGLTKDHDVIKAQRKAAMNMFPWQTAGKPPGIRPRPIYPLEISSSRI